MGKSFQAFLFIGLLLCGVFTIPVKPENNETGNSEEHCDECLLNRIAVPKEFSGDLNELAELAYKNEKPQLSKVGFEDLDVKNNDEPQVPVKPGYELIGGYGVDESENTAEGGEVSNLQIGEGSEWDEWDKRSASKVPEIKEVKHKSEILSEDSKKKEQEITELKSQLEMLRTEKLHTEQEIKKIKEFEDTEIDRLRQEGDKNLVQTKENYEKETNQIKTGSTHKISKVHDEEQRMHERKLLEIKMRSEKLKQKWKQEIDRVTTELHQAEAELTDARKRAKDVQEKNPSWKSFENVPTATTHSLSLRKSLIDMKNQLEKLKEQDNEEEEEIAELSEHIKDEEKQKGTLNLRLKQLQKREEIIKQKEKEFEVTNANLRHQLDESESKAEENAEILAHSRETIMNSLPNAMEREEQVVSQQEKEFEDLALKSARDEIARLKQQLETKEHREAHEEELLLQQEKQIQSDEEKVQQLTLEAEKVVQEGDKEIDETIYTATEEANRILEKAEKEAKKYEEIGKEEETDIGKEEREKKDF